MPKKREIVFEPEIKEYLQLKSPSTAHAYSNGFVRFLEYYQSKYGEGKNIGDFLDRIFEERKKPRREQIGSFIQPTIKFKQNAYDSIMIGIIL